MSALFRPAIADIPMLFNSIDFLLFFTGMVFAFFLLPHRVRWVLLLAGSYYFYACWRAEYLVLIVFTTVLSYFAGLGMARYPGHRRLCLVLSLLINLGILCVFKYFNFLNASLRDLFGALSLSYDIPALDVLLPVGISFYTFQTLSYNIDVYRGHRPPERHLGLFALYVSFFPQLVAGPIERSTTLLPQFFQRMGFDWSRMTDGLKLILWGFFKKLVIADRLARYVNEVYGDPSAHSGGALLLGTYFFAFQIFCDFSGYSDIAIGASKVMGYDLMENFRRPYFARNIRDFWQRWHISLSTWFRDYLYIPLGGNRCSSGRWLFNVYMVFLWSGLWHGANWTFMVWGGLHGLYFLLSSIGQPFRTAVSRRIGLDRLPALQALVQMAITFHLALLAWVFFRAGSVGQAFEVIGGIFRLDLANPGIEVGLTRYELLIAFAAIGLLQTVHALAEWTRWRPLAASSPTWIRWFVCYALFFGILMFGEFNSTEFIYFQF